MTGQRSGLGRSVHGVTDYETFVRAQLPRLSRCAVMLTGERDQAADLVQDVLVKVFRRWRQIAAADQPEHYVLRMLTNQYLSWRRSWTVRSIFPTAVLPDRPHPGDAAAELAVRDDMWQRLVRLPRRQRAVLVLRYYEQLADSEIADILGCSAISVRGYAHRALTTLRTALSEESMADIEEKR